MDVGHWTTGQLDHRRAHESFMPSLHNTRSGRRVFVDFKETRLMVRHAELPDVVERVPRKLRTEAREIGLGAFVNEERQRGQ